MEIVGRGMHVGTYTFWQFVDEKPASLHNADKIRVYRHTTVIMPYTFLWRSKYSVTNLGIFATSDIRLKLLLVTFRSPFIWNFPMSRPRPMYFYQRLLKRTVIWPLNLKCAGGTHMNFDTVQQKHVLCKCSLAAPYPLSCKGKSSAWSWLNCDHMSALFPLHARSFTLSALPSTLKTFNAVFIANFCYRHFYASVHIPPQFHWKLRVSIWIRSYSQTVEQSSWTVCILCWLLRYDLQWFSL